MDEKERREHKTWIGVDIGGTKTAVVLSSHPPAMLARIEFPTLPDQGPQRAIELIKQSIHRLIGSPGIDQIQAGRHRRKLRRPVGSGSGRDSGAAQPGHMGRCAHYLHSAPGVRARLQNGKRRQRRGGCRASVRSGPGHAPHDLSDHGNGFRRGRNRRWPSAQRSIGPGRRDRPCPAHCLGAGRVYNKAGSVEGWVSGGGMAQVACSAS